MACEKVFARKLRERGLRLTPQRELVLSALHATEGLATADAIYAQVHSVASAVDVSTVYRTLDLLQELGLVACIDMGDGERRYELLGVHGPHVHLICRACGEVSGIDLAEAQPLAAHLEERYGFVADLAHLSITGLCRSCAQRD
ncbi:MAG: transcriptional repressor [Anaerolineae bacterium]|nr:transcriptional repressor [Anaerolineae bacterium]